MKLSRNRVGELFIVAEALLWAAFPIVTKVTYKFLPPIHTLAYATLAAAVFFGILFIFNKGWRELSKWEAWKPILLSTFIIAILFYAFFFWGLQTTTAGNASIISQMELWFSFIFFGLILRKEKYTRAALLGALLMFVGVMFVLFDGFSKVSKGDFLIFFATMIPPLGNHFQQTARKFVSTTTLLFVRNILGGIFLLIFSSLIETTPTIQNFSAALPLLLLNGVALWGISKIFWVEGIHRITVAQGLSISAITPIVTLLYVYLLSGEIPQLPQVFGLLPILAGGYLIVNKKFLRNEEILD
ncbi:MAG: DMT family transporter [Candidatus Gracilibacteria bacterium]|nr:DMT family transporter [Candidatus Gracilibacteria bacterium]MDD5178933.1 DMT family transporter [Candidatus Gracilibacteria bacterium]